MKRVAFLIVCIFLLAVPACAPALPTLIPVDTLVAQTMAAMPKTNTPLPSKTPVPTDTPQPSPTALEVDFSAPGAYCIPTNTLRTHALVTKVLDGDTIEVVAGLETFRVRYLGINAPRLTAPSEWQSGQAFAVNEMLVSGKVVTLIQDVSNSDAEGNLLRYVMLNSTFVNYEIVRRGMAQIAIVPPDTACENALIAAQVEAQSTIAGVWQASPVPTFTITPSPTITNTPLPSTPTSIPPCDCTGPRLSCNDFRDQERAQECFDYCRIRGYGDVFNLDKNDNGEACEGMN